MQHVWGREEAYTGILLENLGERDHLEGPGIGGRIEDNIKMNLQEVGCEGMDWIKLAKYRDRWWALLIAVMNHWVQLKVGSFLTS
jgi:hypothetical protein